MGKRIVILIIGVLYLAQSKAQSRLLVRGTIQDSSSATLSNATIRLWTGNDTLLLLSGTNGQFAASIPQGRGEWNILVTMQGFHAYHSNFPMPENTKVLTLPPILLRAEYLELQAVIVHQERPLTIKVDTLEYHAGAYAMREGSMLADLLKKLPGIRLDPDSSVYVMGKKIGKVFLDGKPFFSGDVSNAIRNLPYDIIDRIEIIDDYGDQARLTGVKTGEPDKVMNVVLRQDRRNGQFGSLDGGPGGQGQYTAIATANAFAGDRKFSLVGGFTNTNPFGQERVRVLNLNYADNWGPAWSGSGDASLSGNSHLFQNAMLQDSYFSQGYTHLIQNNTTQGTNQQQQLNYEWLYAPSPKTKLRIDASFRNQTSRETSNINLSSSELDSGFNKASRSMTTNQLTNHNSNAESKLYFESISPHSGQRFSADADIKYAGVLQAGDNLTTTQTQTDSFSGPSIQHYRLNDADYKWDITANLHYYLPLGTKSLWETGYGFHQTLDHSNRAWQQPDTIGKNWQTVDSLSNDYDFRTIVQDLRTAYSRHGDKTDLDLALIAEPGGLSGISSGKENNQPYHYFNLLPMGSFSYSLSRAQKIRLGYDNSVTVPTLQQVQPVTDLSNPQYPVTGNPGLKPAINRTINLNYELNSLEPTNYHGLGIGIGYTTIEDQVIPNIVHPKDTGVIIQQTYFENVNSNNILKLDWRMDLPALFQKQLKISYWGALSAVHGISMTDNLPLVTNTGTLSQNLNLQYTITDRLEANVYAIYNHSLTRYSSNINPSLSASSFIWGMNNRHYFFRNWALRYEFMQTFTSGLSQGLSRGPTILNVHVERSFLKKRQLTCSLSGINLFNENAGVTQTVTPNPTTITQNRAGFVARNVLFTVQWKFERFPRKKL